MAAGWRVETYDIISTYLSLFTSGHPDAAPVVDRFVEAVQEGFPDLTELSERFLIVAHQSTSFSRLCEDFKTFLHENVFIVHEEITSMKVLQAVGLIRLFADFCAIKYNTASRHYVVQCACEAFAESGANEWIEAQGGWAVFMEREPERDSAVSTAQPQETPSQTSRFPLTPPQTTRLPRTPPPTSGYPQAPSQISPPQGSSPLCQSSPQQSPTRSPPQQTPSQSSPRQSPARSPPQQTPPQSSPRRSPARSPPQHTPPQSSPRQSPMHSPQQEEPMSTRPRTFQRQLLPKETMPGEQAQTEMMKTFRSTGIPPNPPSYSPTRRNIPKGPKSTMPCGIPTPPPGYSKHTPNYSDSPPTYYSASPNTADSLDTDHPIHGETRMRPPWSSGDPETSADSYALSALQLSRSDLSLQFPFSPLRPSDQPPITSSPQYQSRPFPSESGSESRPRRPGLQLCNPFREVSPSFPDASDSSNVGPLESTQPSGSVRRELFPGTSTVSSIFGGNSASYISQPFQMPNRVPGQSPPPSYYTGSYERDTEIEFQQEQQRQRHSSLPSRLRSNGDDDRPKDQTSNTF